MVDEEELRTLALPLPGVAEVPDWGRSLFRVHRRTFMKLDGPGTRVRARIRLGRWLRLRLRGKRGHPALRAARRPGWVCADLALMDLDTARDLVHESWRHAALPHDMPPLVPVRQPATDTSA